MDPLADYRRAEELLAGGDPLGAARLIAPLADAESDNAMVQALAGRAYFATAQLRRAEAAFGRVVELDPSDHWARFALGRTFERLNRPAQAAQQYRIAVAMHPDPEYSEALRRVAGKEGPPVHGKRGTGSPY
jgi:Flp pilus assembly protein TadD